MPGLLHVLQGADFGFLRIVANAWGIELDAPDVNSAASHLARAICTHPLFNEVIEALPVEARQALRDLMKSEGRMSWALFCRRYGEVRVIGPGRRDRERPDLHPVSAAEVLWYRALIGKAFFDLPPEPQEYAYIPDDILARLHPPRAAAPAPLGRPAAPEECAQTLPAEDRILDHACTLLAALRSGLDAAALELPLPAPVLKGLLAAAGLLDCRGMPEPEATRAFLEAGRAEALALLARSWAQSAVFNELKLLPGLVFEGEWENDPLRARQTILEMLQQLPAGRWWSLSAFTAAAREQHPDFQRPAGDYDSWFIRKAGSGQYLRGFSSWDEVDGALLRFMICGPLHWLGILDLAAPGANAAPAAFRFSDWGAALLAGDPPAGLSSEEQPLRVGADGLIRGPARSARPARYQVARFCRWEEPAGEDYLYRLTPSSLQKAREQGLRVTHLLAVLHRCSAGPLPPRLVKALEQWEKFGSQAILEKLSLLRVASPQILEALRQSKAKRYLGEALNATVVIVKPGGEEALRRALAELGYLADLEMDV